MTWLTTWRSGPKSGPDQSSIVLVEICTIPESGTVVDFGRNGTGSEDLADDRQFRELGQRLGALVVDGAVIDRVRHEHRGAMCRNAIDEVDRVADVDELLRGGDEERVLARSRLRRDHRAEPDATLIETVLPEERLGDVMQNTDARDLQRGAVELR